MRDIRFVTDDYMFSYRVAGILVCDGYVLLQKPVGGSAFAFPGGQVSFGETSAEALVREWKEEVGADITVKQLKWVDENTFPSWKGDGRTCQQVCLTYLIELKDNRQIPLKGSFMSRESNDNPLTEKIEFWWVKVADLDKYTVYPVNAVGLLSRLDDGVQHFVYNE